jgi:hypothetical protein
MTTEERLTKLQRSLRRWKLGAILGVGLAVAMGSVRKDDVPDIVRARAFVLVGKDDTPRASLSVKRDDYPMFFMTGPGIGKAELHQFVASVNRDGSTNLWLSRKEDKQALVSLGTSPEGHGFVILANAAGEPMFHKP